MKKELWMTIMYLCLCAMALILIFQISEIGNDVKFIKQNITVTKIP